MAPRPWWDEVRSAVVLAGGLGTRVAHLTGRSCAKALLPVDGQPFIDIKLAQLAAAGVTRAVLLLGHGAGALRAHVGDGSKLGLEVVCREDGPRLLGTGGAIRAAIPELPERFWVTYGDTLLSAPLADVETHLVDPLVGVMTVLENHDRWAPSNTAVTDGLVARYEKDTAPGTLHWIDYGLLFLHRDAFEGCGKQAAFDLGVVLRTAVEDRRLAAYPVTERFHDVGTEAAWRETDAWARSTRLWDRLRSRREGA